MKNFRIEFSIIENAIIQTRAVSVLVDQGFSKKEARDRVSADTPQNVLRLALGFDRRQRGGARPNTGRRRERRMEEV
jgi:hypothetical protein